MSCLCPKDVASHSPCMFLLAVSCPLPTDPLCQALHFPLLLLQLPRPPTPLPPPVLGLLHETRGEAAMVSEVNDPCSVTHPTATDITTTTIAAVTAITDHHRCCYCYHRPPLPLLLSLLLYNHHHYQHHSYYY